MPRPFLRLDGCDMARLMTRVFRENLHDLADKFDDGSGEYERGYLHTSTELAPGTNYYNTVWSRDGGRGLIELALFGYVEEAVAIAEFFLRHINGGDHWSRIIDHEPDPHAIETDGNGLALLGIYQAWRVSGADPGRASDWLDGLLKVAGWAKRLSAESPFGCLLPSRSELSGNPERGTGVYALYTNYVMALGLEGVARIAEAAGRKEAAEVGELGQSILSDLARLLKSDGKISLAPKGIWFNGLDPRTGGAYDNAEWCGIHFPIFHWTRQAPCLLLSDLTGYRLEGSPDPDMELRSFDYVLGAMNRSHLFRKYGFVSNTAWTGMGDRHDDTMCGYGQSFFTQSALHVDHVNAYSLMLEGMARLAFDGHIVEPATYERSPWLLHECFHYENYEEGLDHTFGRLTGHQPGGMDNPGDEGNLVQACEGVKALRLVMGANSLDPARPEIMPRLPWNWDRLEAKNVFFLTPQGPARVDYTLELDWAEDECRFSLGSDVPLENLTVRLGPFPRRCHLPEDAGTIEENKWAKWLRIEGLSGETVERVVEVR